LLATSTLLKRVLFGKYIPSCPNRVRPGTAHYQYETNDALLGNVISKPEKRYKTATDPEFMIYIDRKISDRLSQ